MNPFRQFVAKIRSRRRARVVAEQQAAYYKSTREMEASRSVGRRGLIGKAGFLALAAALASAPIELPPAPAQAMSLPSAAAYEIQANVMAFGAFGDGSHDDTAACQAAINWVQSLPYGGRVFFPPGQFLVSGLTISNTGVALVGCGIASWIVHSSATGDCIKVYNATPFITRQIIRDLAFGKKAGVTATAGNMINFTNAQEFRVENVVIFNYPAAPWNGLYCSNSWNYFVHNCEIAGMLNTGVLSVNSGGGQNMTDCQVNACGSHGLYFDGSAGGYFSGINCYNNTGCAFCMATPSPTTYNTQYFFANCIGDTSGQDNFQLNFCAQAFFTNCWGSSQQGTANYCGFHFVSSYARNISVVGGGALFNGGAGVYCDATGGAPFNICFLGFICGSSTPAQGNGQHSGGASGYYFGAGCTGIQIIGGQCLGNVNGPIGGTLPGAGSVIRDVNGYNPVGISAATSTGTSGSTITAGPSWETHYIKQSATFNAAVTKGGQALGTVPSANAPIIVSLGPAESYTVTWTTTQPTYTKDVH